MNLRQLEYFCAVVEEHSFSAAARKLHLSQPPLSRQVMLLEHELGVTLFNRTNKGVILTDAGRSLYSQGYDLMQSMATIADDIRNTDAGINGILRIGVLYSTVSFALPYIRTYHERYPDVELVIRLGTPQELIGSLQHGSLNVIFLRSSSGDTIDLNKRILAEDSLELVMTAATDPDPASDAISVSQLKNVPMCLLQSDDLWRYDEFIIKECQNAGFEPMIVSRCYDTPMVMQLVIANFGVSFLPRSIIETHKGSGVYSRPIRGIDIKSYTALIWDNRKYIANRIRRFISLTEQQNYGSR